MRKILVASMFNKRFALKSTTRYQTNIWIFGTSNIAGDPDANRISFIKGLERTSEYVSQVSISLWMYSIMLEQLLLQQCCKWKLVSLDKNAEEYILKEPYYLYH